MLRNIHSQGCLAHAWPGRDDNHLGGMKAGCHTVKFNESGRESGDRSSAFVELLNFINGFHDELFCRPHVDLRVVAGDRENLLFNGVQ